MCVWVDGLVGFGSHLQQTIFSPPQISIMDSLFTMVAVVRTRSPDEELARCGKNMRWLQAPPPLCVALRWRVKVGGERGHSLHAVFPGRTSENTGNTPTVW